MDFELVLWQALAVLAAMLAAWFVWQGLTGLWVARPSPLAALPDNLAGDLDHEADRLHALERVPLLERLVEIHEDDPRSQKAMLQAVSLKGRSEVVKALAAPGGLVALLLVCGILFCERARRRGRRDDEPGGGA